MVEVLDIDRDGLVRMGAGVFAALERGTIIYVRGVDEIRTLANRLVKTLAERPPTGAAAEVQKFFKTGRTPDTEALEALLLALRELRDARYMPCLFADLIAGFGLPAPRLIDTGYFRCVFQKSYAALRANPLLPRDLHEPVSGETAEPFLYGTNLGGRPHRDVDVPHYTFQMNFWFPLHDVPAENSLLLFPEIYKSDVPYQQKPEHLREPDRWGYGKALRRALSLGDMVLFHSQHFHASPSEAPDSDRLSAELRVASACIDDNAVIYRRLFWREENFQPLAVPNGSAARAARLFPHKAGPGDDPALTPQELFAGLFECAEDARHAGDLWGGESSFSRGRRLAPEDLSQLTGRLHAGPFAEDRQIAMARYLLAAGQRDRAERLFTETVERSDSYFFTLEIARLAGEARLWVPAGSALLKAAALAQTSTVAIGRYRGDIPARPLPRLQVLPEDVQRCAPVLIQALHSHLSAPDSKPPPLLDYRLFFPFVVVAHPVDKLGGLDGAIVQVRSVLVYVPEHRLAEVGLRPVPHGTTRRFEGSFNPASLVSDPTGLVVVDNLNEMMAKLVQIAAKKKARRSGP